ncbi:MAG: CoA transferase subunit A [Candidatus Heteroscillospira sp.]|jgi:3-oxoacid CoA-transferase A subunit
MIDKVIPIKKAIDKIKSGDTLLIGGFIQDGSPMNLLRELSTRDISGLTAVSEDIGYANSTFYPKTAITALYDRGLISRVCVSYIGNNKLVNGLIQAGKLEAEFIPQGTLIERIRAGGSGIGGFYTPTGVGTVVENGKEKKVIGGKEYILELALRGNVALVKAHKADCMGNAVFKYTSQNFNTMMATAADITILEVEELVKPGELNPEHVQLPGVFVDYVVLPEGDVR